MWGKRAKDDLKLPISVYFALYLWDCGAYHWNFDNDIHRCFSLFFLKKFNMVIVREKIKIHNQICENYSLCWFALTLDWSIQHNFATLLEVVRSPLILSVSENGSSHISKKNFLLKIDYVYTKLTGILHWLRITIEHGS